MGKDRGKAERGTNPVGVEVKKMREERGLSLRELAERAGISYRTIWSVENGERKPQGAKLRKILETLQGIPKLPGL